MKEILDQVQKDPSAITNELLASLAEPLNTAEQKAKAAFGAYHEDLEVRRNKLAQQDAVYTARIVKLKGDRAKLAAQINDLSSRGEIDKAAEADIQIEAVDKEITALERKKRIISITELKGDSQLYQAAKAALDSFSQENKLYIERVHQIEAVAAAERERLNNLIKAMGSTVHYQTVNLGYKENDFKKVDRHFRDLDRIEKEAKERYAEEYKRKEAEEAARRNVRVIVPSGD